MSNTISKEPKDHNNLYIAIVSVIIALVIIIVLVAKGCSGKKSDSPSSDAASQNAGVSSISVISEGGDQQAVLDADIQVRNVKFSKKISKIKKYESKQKDTLDDPSVAKSQDGYTYLSYKYNADKAPTFFGAQVSASDPMAMLVYVFHNKKLIEVRFQYGNIGKSGYDNIVSTMNASYGAATYSRSYSNGTEESWWKTDAVTLDVIYQESCVIAYYRTNNR